MPDTPTTRKSLSNLSIGGVGLDMRRKPNEDIGVGALSSSLHRLELKTKEGDTMNTE